MFQTRRQLKERISELETTLAHEIKMNAIPEKMGLAKCKGMICNACEHAVFVDDWYESKRLIGCDTQTCCSEFKKKTS